MKSILIRAVVAALCALSLTGCIDSASPILSDSQPLFGEFALELRHQRQMRGGKR